MNRWRRLPFWDDCGAMYFALRCVLPYLHEGWHFCPEDQVEVYDFGALSDGIHWSQGNGVEANPFISAWEIAHQEEHGGITDHAQVH